MISTFVTAFIAFSTSSKSQENIVSLAVATPELSTLVAALKAADLVGTLSGSGPFTVFAPTNEAFAALPAGLVTKLLKPENKAELVDLLTYHVASGDVHAKDLSDKEMIKTVEGKDVTVRLNGTKVWINNADVIMADVDASNGVVHIIDAVLAFPTECANSGFSQCGGKGFSGLTCCPSGFTCELKSIFYSQCIPGTRPPSATSIVDLAVATPDLSTLVAALKAADLVGTLSGPGPFTVFAPTNEAFAALPAGVVAKLLKPENKAELVDLLTYHVASGDVRAKDLSDKEKIKTVEGKDVRVRLSGSEVWINNADVTIADVVASNGVVHIIDAVLALPNGCDSWGFSQCGGKGFSGLTCCPSGFMCDKDNEYYSQCKVTPASIIA